MLSTKSGLLWRLFVNSIITAIVAWLAMNLGLLSLASEMSDYDLIMTSVIVLLAVPLVIELVIHPLERMLLLKLLTLGFFGLLARMAVWGVAVWYIPNYFHVYYNNFSLISLSAEEWSKFLCLVAVLAILRLKKKD